MPRLISFKLVSTPPLPMDATVSQLINGDNQWDEGLIYQYFVKEDAYIITRIPLPSRPMADQILWHYDKKKKKNYSIKSIY